MASEEEDAEQPRRSGRARKGVERLGYKEGPSKRRKVHRDEDAEDEDLDDGMGDEDELSPVDSEADYVVKEPQKKPTRRTTAAQTKRSANIAASRTSKTRSAALQVGDDGAGVSPDVPGKTDIFKGEYSISHDNTLFEAVRDPRSALADTVEEWIQKYQADGEKRGEALAELVNFVIRACGCNLSVDKHEAEDLDGAAGKLEDIQDIFKQSGSRLYPLVAKSKALKAFRKSLNDFVWRLAQQTDQAGVLYDSFFSEAWQTWLAAATSSRVRSFRHTATVIALEFVTALCPITVSRNAALQQATRAREKEREKRSAEKSRLKAFETEVKHAHDKKISLDRFLKDVFNAVFMNRYRDAEPTIRRECIQALGQWMKLHPVHFVTGNFLRYIGWVLTDANKDTRLEAVKALGILYENREHIGSLRHFTERFRGRLVEMASCEIDMQVRVGAINALHLISGHGLLEDEQIDQMARLIYHVDAKVRKAVASFFVSLVDEEVAQRESSLAKGKAPIAGSSSSLSQHRRRLYLKMKCLCEALVKYGASLDSINQANPDVQDPREMQMREATASSAPSARKSRVTDALDALWVTQSDALTDWQAIMDYLVLDHTAPVARGHTSGIDKDLGLTEAEESIMLEILIASAKGCRRDAESSSKKSKDLEAESVIGDLTRALMKALPKLFIKYKTDARRLSDVLLLIGIMDLELYQSMRITNAFGSLWNDVTDAFKLHTDPAVLESALQAMSTMLSVKVLEQINESKMSELEEFLTDALTLAVAHKDPSTAGFDADALRKIEAAVLRLASAIRMRDLSSIMEFAIASDTMSPLSIVLALTDRGLLGYADEDTIVENALSILFYFLAWKVHFLVNVEGGASGIEITLVADVQTSVVDRLSDLAIGESSKASHSVREWAFVYLLDLHVLFYGVNEHFKGVDEKWTALSLGLDDQLSFRLADFMHTVIERYIEMLSDVPRMHAARADTRSESDTDATTDVDDADTSRGKAAGSANAVNGERSQSATLSKIQLQIQSTFRRVLSTYVRCISVGVLDIRQASVVLTHFGRLDAFYDQCARSLCDVMRARGIYGDQGQSCAAVMVDSLRDATTLVVDGVSKEATLLTLAKAFVVAVLVRGAQLTIVGKIDNEHLLRIHLELVAHAVEAYAALEEMAASDEKKHRVLLLFKALGILSTILSGKDALKIQGFMDEAFRKASIQPSVTLKLWDDYRLYVKKLTSAMSKDQSIKTAARKRAANAAEKEEAGETTIATQDARPRPVPRAAVKGRGGGQAIDYGEGSDFSEHDNVGGGDDNTVAEDAALEHWQSEDQALSSSPSPSKSNHISGVEGENDASLLRDGTQEPSNGTVDLLHDEREESHDSIFSMSHSRVKKARV